MTFYKNQFACNFIMVSIHCFRTYFLARGIELSFGFGFSYFVFYFFIKILIIKQ